MRIRNRNEFGSNEQLETVEFSPEQVDQLHAELNDQFDEEEAKERWKQALEFNSGYSSPNFFLHERKFGSLTFSVHFHLQKGQEKLEFQILDNKETQIDKAHLIFVRKFSFEENNEPWNLEHRLVNAKDIGVTGTDFLKKAEEYLKLIDKLGIKNIDKVYANVSQPKVIDWLLKNGYKFADEKSEKQFQDFTDHPDEYEEVFIPDGNNEHIKDLYYFRKEDLDLKTGKLGRHVDGQHEGRRRVVIDVRKLDEIPGVFRVRLEKAL